MPTSRLSGFHQLTMDQRWTTLAREGWILPGEQPVLLAGAPESTLERLSESVLGCVRLPRGIVTNAIIDGTDVLLPFATEEPSIVAACSKAALLVREGGGVRSGRRRRVALAQLLVRVRSNALLQAPKVDNLLAALVILAAQRHPRWTAAGGTLLRLSLHPLPGAGAGLSCFNIEFDPRDTMGANLADSLASLLAQVVDTRDYEVLTPIVSNHPVLPHLEVSVAIPMASLAWKGNSGSVVAERIASLSRWAHHDPARCTTHNKGVMNGIEALLTATYQDTRAASAALYAAAHELGVPRPLVRWHVSGELLHGRFEGTIPCGTVGGTSPHMPEIAMLWRWMSIHSALDLEVTAASAGLLQNLGALRALATEGIEAGHLRLHARKNGSAAS